MIWVLVDKIGLNVVRIIAKAITAGLIGLLELEIFADMTIKKKDNHMRKCVDSSYFVAGVLFYGISNVNDDGTMICKS